jgi:hypothetical protein
MSRIDWKKQREGEYYGRSGAGANYEAHRIRSSVQGGHGGYVLFKGMGEYLGFHYTIHAAKKAAQEHEDWLNSDA